jgi:uncharacterized protein YecE (DUF72 family)
MRRPPVRIGCSGWDYPHWRGSFYPPDLARRQWLAAYGSVFDTVELNNSFYRLPDARRFATWAQTVPPDFLFAVKASRFLTHVKRLRDAAEPIERLLDSARHLGPALGPILYQLPPRWVPDLERFEAFLDRLPETARTPDGAVLGLRHCVEFRDPRGYGDRYLDLLRRFGVALCLQDMPASEAPCVITAGFTYVRFHGHGGSYGGAYAPAVLERWASWLADAHLNGTGVFAYFNNDAGGHAPRDAQRLRDLLDRLLRAGTHMA